MDIVIGFKDIDLDVNGFQDFGETLGYFQGFAGC